MKVLLSAVVIASMALGFFGSGVGDASAKSRSTPSTGYTDPQQFKPCPGFTVVIMNNDTYSNGQPRTLTHIVNTCR